MQHFKESLSNEIPTPTLTTTIIKTAASENENSIDMMIPLESVDEENKLAANVEADKITPTAEINEISNKPPQSILVEHSKVNFAISSTENRSNGDGIADENLKMSKTNETNEKRENATELADLSPESEDPLEIVAKTIIEVHSEKREKMESPPVEDSSSTESTCIELPKQEVSVSKVEEENKINSEIKNVEKDEKEDEPSGNIDIQIVEEIIVKEANPVESADKPNVKEIIEIVETVDVEEPEEVPSAENIMEITKTETAVNSVDSTDGVVAVERPSNDNQSPDKSATSSLSLLSNKESIEVTQAMLISERAVSIPNVSDGLKTKEAIDVSQAMLTSERATSLPNIPARPDTKKSTEITEAMLVSERADSLPQTSPSLVAKKSMEITEKMLGSERAVSLPNVPVSPVVMSPIKTTQTMLLSERAASLANLPVKQKVENNQILDSPPSETENIAAPIVDEAKDNPSKVIDEVPRSENTPEVEVFDLEVSQNKSPKVVEAVPKPEEKSTTKDKEHKTTVAEEKPQEVQTVPKLENEPKTEAIERQVVSESTIIPATIEESIVITENIVTEKTPELVPIEPNESKEDVKAAVEANIEPTQNTLDNTSHSSDSSSSRSSSDTEVERTPISKVDEPPPKPIERIILGVENNQNSLTDTSKREVSTKLQSTYAPLGSDSNQQLSKPPTLAKLLTKEQQPEQQANQIQAPAAPLDTKPVKPTPMPKPTSLRGCIKGRKTIFSIEYLYPTILSEICENHCLYV